MKTLQSTALQRADKRAAMQELRDKAAHKLYMAEIKLDPALGLRRAKAAAARRKRELLDPNHHHVRFYPAYSGQSVLQYIRTYQALNGKLSNTSHMDFVNLRGERL